MAYAVANLADCGAALSVAATASQLFLAERRIRWAAVAAAIAIRFVDADADAGATKVLVRARADIDPSQAPIEGGTDLDLPAVGALNSAFLAAGVLAGIVGRTVGPRVSITTDIQLFIACIARTSLGVAPLGVAKGIRGICALLASLVADTGLCGMASVARRVSAARDPIGLQLAGERERGAEQCQSSPPSITSAAGWTSSQSYALHNVWSIFIARRHSDVYFPESTCVESRRAWNVPPALRGLIDGILSDHGEVAELMTGTSMSAALTKPVRVDAGRRTRHLGAWAEDAVADGRPSDRAAAGLPGYIDARVQPDAVETDFAVELPRR